MGGRQPLCGNGVTSVILLIFKPQAFNDLTADSLPAPGPLTFTSKLIIPNSSMALVPTFSAAICAANGVLFRDPRKPEPPEVAHHISFPFLSVMVIIVLLKD